MDPLGCIIPLHNPQGRSAMEVPTPTLRRRLLRLLRLVVLDRPLRSHHMSTATVLCCAGILKSGYPESADAVATTAGGIYRENTYVAQVHVQPDAVVLDYSLGW